MTKRKAYGTRISFDIPEPIRRLVKAKCVMEGTSVTEAMQRLVFDFIDEDYDKYYGEDIEKIQQETMLLDKFMEDSQ